MKNLLLIVTLIFSFASANPQSINITDVDVSAINQNAINVNLKVITSGADFVSSTFTLNGQEINLKVCYSAIAAGWFLPLDNDFQINLQTLGNYTLNIIVYNSLSYDVCDFDSI